jgi:hypothetical protein
MTSDLRQQIETALGIRNSDGFPVVPVDIFSRQFDNVSALIESVLAQARREAQWQPIATAPKDAELFFWVRPWTAEEGWVDTSGNPIVSHAPPRLHRGRLKSWSSLETATHWMPLPPAPASVPKE